jgi:hypothetical protein
MPFGQAHIQERLGRRGLGIPDDPALLVLHNSVAPFEDAERAQVSELRGQRVQRSALADYLKPDAVPKSGLGQFLPPPDSGKTQTRVQAPQPEVGLVHSL